MSVGPSHGPCTEPVADRIAMIPVHSGKLGWARTMYTTAQTALATEIFMAVWTGEQPRLPLPPATAVLCVPGKSVPATRACDPAGNQGTANTRYYEYSYGGHHVKGRGRYLLPPARLYERRFRSAKNPKTN